MHASAFENMPVNSVGNEYPRALIKVGIHQHDKEHETEEGGSEYTALLHSTDFCERLGYCPVFRYVHHHTAMELKFHLVLEPLCQGRMGSVFGTQPAHDVHFSRSDILVSDDVLQRMMRHQDSTTPVVSKAMTAPAPPPPEPTPQPAQDPSSALRLSHSLDDIERRFEARLKKIEKRDDSFLKEAEAEFVRVVDRLEAKYLKGSSEACCLAAQKQVADCYKANGKQSLNCAKEVNEFVSCVANFRAARMTRAQPAAT
ncbi:hypothetical protein SprV_0100079400 [Sparganum proliferum]